MTLRLFRPLSACVALSGLLLTGAPARAANFSGSYNLILLKEADFFTASGQSFETNTGPDVLLGMQGQWQPGFNVTGGGTTGYSITADFGQVFPVTQIQMQTHFRAGQSLSEFFVEGSTDNVNFTTIGHYTGPTITSGVLHTFTPVSPVNARYVRYRVDAGDYTATANAQNYGGPGILTIEVTADTAWSSFENSFNIAFAGWGSDATKAGTINWNRGGNEDVTIDGRFLTGALAHNHANGWDGTPEEVDGELTIQLFRRSIIDEIEIIWAGSRDRRFSSNAYTILGSLDGVTFNIPITYTTNTTTRAGGSDFLTLTAPVEVAFLRFTDMNLPTTGFDPTVGIQEVLVFGALVPEPASMLVLTLGGLALFRRRMR